MKIAVSFVDLLFVLLTVFIFKWILAVLLINTADVSDPTPPNKAEFLVIIEWDASLDSDVDLWAMRESTPKSLTGFSCRECDVFILQNDDTSYNYGSVSGYEKKISRETMIITQLIPDTYRISLHGYRLSRDTPVRVSIYKTKPYRIIFTGEVMVSDRQETPVISFDVDENGAVINVVTGTDNLRTILD